MGIRVTAQEGNPSTIYPLLRQCRQNPELIIMFTAPTRGVILSCDTPSRVGCLEGGWIHHDNSFWVALKSVTLEAI